MRAALRFAMLSAALSVLSGGWKASTEQSASVPSGTCTESIVVLRHGEKAIDGLGQLNCKGLNRSLALPKLLIGRFGRAHAIFSPSPAYQMKESALSAKSYTSYGRPRAKIDRTAAQLGLPADT